MGIPDCSYTHSYNTRRPKDVTAPTPAITQAVSQPLFLRPLHTHLDECGLADAQLDAGVRGRHAVDAQVHGGQQVGRVGGQDGSEGRHQEGHDLQALGGAGNGLGHDGNAAG